jgi:conjugative relaxase-like TrwC/TraI family protein
MLTISKPLSAGQAQNYHQKEFTAKEQNYWSQRGVIAGEWQGGLAAQLGLAGAVSAEDFAKLSQGQHPVTGEQLVRQRASYEYHDTDGKSVKTMEHRAGWDATFSAPKSVSLTALVGGDNRIREAHRDSVRIALEQLEHYTQARIGGNHLPETTGKFIAAKFEHDTARPVDGYVAPQLHAHAVIFNVTERENLQARAIQPQSLFASQQFATAVYQSELTYRLRELGYEITIGKSGAPDIKGYTQEYLDASSPRSQQIREYLERTGRHGKEAAEIAAHSTRDRKKIHSPGEVMAAHRKLAADFGHQADAVVRAARERKQHQEKPANTHDRVRESLTFSRDKNFEREAVVDERALIRDGLRRGMGEVTYAQVRGNLDSRIASGEFQTVERTHLPGRQFTTAKTIAAEQEIVSRVRGGRNQIEPVLSRSQAIAVTDQQPHLNRTQKSVIEDVLSSPDRVQGIQGFAGSGKTTTLSVIRNAAEMQGFQVEGLAPTSRAARQLSEAGVEAGTLQGFLARTKAATDPEQKHFYFVDESSLASTNQVREFLSRLAPQDRVLLIGDTRQHQGVEAGRPFEQLQEAGMRTAKLDEIVRQKDPELKAAVEMLATGQVSRALDALWRQDRIREIPDTEERIRAIARSYVDSPEKTLIVSPDNASRRELNAAVRQELKANGTLAPEDHSFRVLVQRQEMTGAERSWASRYEINDIVRYARGSKNIGIEAGDYGTVVGINSASNMLTIEKSRGELVDYDPRRLAGVSIYREVARDFSEGDRIQFTAPDRGLGVVNRELAVIESVKPDGRIATLLNNNRRVEFNAGEHRHFDHGYAVTSHSSQGLTAERVLINADANAHPDLVNSRFAYVAVSRGSHTADLYVSDLHSLRETLNRDVTKTSAIDLSEGGNRLARDVSTNGGDQSLTPIEGNHLAV